jgi:hypothetical protein
MVKALPPAAKSISEAPLNAEIETSVMFEVAKVAMSVGTVPEDQLAPVFQSLLKGLASQVPLSKLARLEQGKSKTASSGMKCCLFIWRYNLIPSRGVFLESLFHVSIKECYDSRANWHGRKTAVAIEPKCESMV